MGRKPGPKSITDKTKKKIIAEYAVCGNYSEVARKYGFAVSTIRTIVKESPEFEKICIEKAKEDTLSTMEFLEKRTSRINKLLDMHHDAIEGKVKNPDMFTSLKDISTSYGILVDKQLKVFEIKQKNFNGDDIDKINEGIASIAKLINSPAKPRNIEDFEK